MSQTQRPPVSVPLPGGAEAWQPTKQGPDHLDRGLAELERLNAETRKEREARERQGK